MAAFGELLVFGVTSQSAAPLIIGSLADCKSALRQRPTFRATDTLNRTLGTPRICVPDAATMMCPAVHDRWRDMWSRILTDGSKRALGHEIAFSSPPRLSFRFAESPAGWLRISLVPRFARSSMVPSKRRSLARYVVAKYTKGETAFKPRKEQPNTRKGNRLMDWTARIGVLALPGGGKGGGVYMYSNLTVRPLGPRFYRAILKVASVR